MFLSFCAELSVKVGDTRTPGLPVKSGLGKDDYARARCAFSKIEIHISWFSSDRQFIRELPSGSAQIGRRLVRLLKTGSRQEDGEWACHFISAGISFLIKKFAIKTKNIYLMGPATVSPPRSSLCMAVAITRAARALGCRSQGRRHDESISTKT